MSFPRLAAGLVRMVDSVPAVVWASSIVAVVATTIYLVLKTPLSG